MLIATRIRRVVTTALALSLLASTAQAKPPMQSVLQPEPDPASGESVIYIRRLPGAVWAQASYFYIDDVEVAGLGIGGCTAVRVPAGAHVLSQRFFRNRPYDLRVPGKWQAGASYYYEFSAKVQSGLPNISPTVQTTYILKIGAPTGRDRLAGCRFTPPTNETPLAAPAIPPGVTEALPPHP